VLATCLPNFGIVRAVFLTYWPRHQLILHLLHILILRPHFTTQTAMENRTVKIVKYRDKSFRTGAVLHQKCPFSHNQKPLFT